MKTSLSQIILIKNLGGIPRNFRFCGHYFLKNAALSIRNYRDMGQGMGQQISFKIRPNYFARKTKEKFRNHGGFGTFMAKVHEVDTILQRKAMQQLFCSVLFR